MSNIFCQESYSETNGEIVIYRNLTGLYNYLIMIRWFNAQLVTGELSFIVSVLDRVSSFKPVVRLLRMRAETGALKNGEWAKIMS